MRFGPTPPASSVSAHRPTIRTSYATRAGALASRQEPYTHVRPKIALRVVNARTGRFRVTPARLPRGVHRVRVVIPQTPGVLGLGSERKLIPVEVIDEVTNDAVRIGATGEHVRGSVWFDPQLAPDERYWHSRYDYYGDSPYSAGR